MIFNSRIADVGPLLSCLATATLLFSGTESLAASPQETLDAAVQEYRAALDSTDRDERLSKFRRAELLFERLADGDASAGGAQQSGGTSGAPNDSIQNADLLVNLGNAALGAERLGPAILAYRRALTLDPDHRRGRQNLAHARSLLPEWARSSDESGWLDTFFDWRTRRSRDEIQMLAAFLFFAAAASFAGSIRWRSAICRNVAWVPACGWFLLLGLLFFADSANAARSAVVVVPEVVARSADSAGSPARLTLPLPSGAEVEVVEVRDDWSHVRLFDGRDAWLPSSALRGVIPLGSTW